MDVSVGVTSSDVGLGSKMPGELEVVGDVVSPVEEARGTIGEGEAGEAFDPEVPEPKLPDAVIDESLDTSTLLTITTSPSMLVTFTSTGAAPKPPEYWKKLYDFLSVLCQVEPPSVLTSRLATALLALTTCMLNHHCDAPSWLWSCKGVVIGHSIYSQVV